MAAGYKTKTLIAESDGGGGWNRIDAFEQELGFAPDGAFADFQISALGLDGGTMAVSVYLPGEDDANNTRQLFGGPGNESDVRHLAGWVVTGFRFAFADCGPYAEPKVTVTGILRGL